MTAPPCNVAAVTSLIENKFYEDTTCHRMTTSDKLKILQCGDPTGTGMSGPGWTSPDEPPTDLKKVGQPDPMSGSQPVVYPRGTVAIANSSQGGQNPNTGSSQLFIVINDSELGPDYSIVGKVDEPGLAVLDKVYAGGITPRPGRQPTRRRQAEAPGDDRDRHHRLAKPAPTTQIPLRSGPATGTERNGISGFDTAPRCARCRLNQQEAPPCARCRLNRQRVPRCARCRLNQQESSALRSVPAQPAGGGYAAEVTR